MRYGIMLLRNSKRNNPFLVSNSCVSESNRQLPFKTNLRVVFHALIINDAISACLKRFAGALTNLKIYSLSKTATKLG